MAALTATTQIAQNTMIGISLRTSPIVLMLIEKNETGGRRMWVNEQIRKTMATLDSEDCAIAVRAGHAMAQRFQEDMAITQELAVVKLSECKEPPLEIVRFRRRTLVDE